MNRSSNTALTMAISLAVINTILPMHGTWGQQADPSPLPGQSLRLAGREPAQAAGSFEVLDGFQMQLVAHEPLVQEPVAICYDENGLLYAAEYLDFPNHLSRGKGQPGGQIRLLQDRDGDGRYEDSHVFAAELQWPTGICAWKGGVFVIAAPDLWYLKDTNGDLQADVRKKVYSGFAFRNEEGTANNLIWGMDHWIYGAGSSSGGQIKIVSRPNAKAVSLSGRDFRFDPTNGDFQAISGGGQFGNTFDDWNNRFICSNSNPATHVVLPARYLARNPYLPVATVRRRVWEGDRVYRASPPEPWRLERSSIRLAQRKDWAATYVRHDVFTAATGVTVYRGAAYPQKYRGNLFVGEVQGNLIHRRVLSPAGVSFSSRRGDQDTEMVRSTDNWFRPTNLVNAPDGTLHVTDMYREVIEAPESLPDAVLERVDLLSGHGRGRIYRLAPPGFKVPPPPQLGSASNEMLVATLENANGWWRDNAQRLLYERRDQTAVKGLRALFYQSKFAQARVHALHALDGLGALDDRDLSTALLDASPGVREHAVRLAESRLARNGDLADRVIELADDAQARVRFQVAFSLGELDAARAAESLAKLARRDADDIWMRTAVLSSSLNLASPMVEHLVSDPGFAARQGGRQFLRQLALVVGGRNRKNDVTRILALAETHPVASRPDVQRSLVLGLGEGLRRSRSSLNRFLQDSPSSANMLSELIRDSKAAVSDSSRPARQRTRAIEMLGHGRFADVEDVLTGMLDARQPPEVQLAAIHALASFQIPQVAELLVNSWSGYSPAVRGEVLQMLLGRTAWINPLLDAVAQRRIATGDIGPDYKARLMAHRDSSIRERSASLLASDMLSPRKDVLTAYQSTLQLPGDASRGQRVFRSECSTCHKVAGQGHEVGPNLATVQNRTPDGLLMQILDPNREVLPNYTNYVIALEDGRVVSGLIASESATSITLKRAENVQETILRQNIDEISATGKSLMPEGLEQKVDKQQMSDLISFLLTIDK